MSRRGRPGAVVAAILVSLVAAGILAWALPAAHARTQREQAGLVLQRQRAASASQMSNLTSQGSAVQAQITAQQAKNAKLQKQVRGQRRQIAALKKQVRSLGG